MHSPAKNESFEEPGYNQIGQDIYYMKRYSEFRYLIDCIAILYPHII